MKIKLQKIKFKFKEVLVVVMPLIVLQAITFVSYYGINALIKAEELARRVAP